MEDHSSDSSGYGKPIEMRLPLGGNLDIEWIFDPPECKVTQRYTGALITFIEKSVYDRIVQHTKSDTRNEVGGALLGKYCIDNEAKQRFILVTEAFSAEPEINENFVAPALMRFTHTFFRRLDEHLDTLNQEDPDVMRLGMYHSHPGFSVFMSETDKATFRNVFSEPWHVSLIIDPLNNDAGVFYWEDVADETVISAKTAFTLFEFKETEDMLKKSEGGSLDVEENKDLPEKIEDQHQGHPKS
jgi:proteasome lid subunit RPN8/RPN11